MIKIGNIKVLRGGFSHHFNQNHIFLDKIKIKNKGKKKMLTPTKAIKHIAKSMLP